MTWMMRVRAVTAAVAAALLAGTAPVWAQPADAQLAPPAAAAAHAQAGVLTVVLVRHAEKLDDSADAALSDAGHRRAQALADALADAGVDAIYTTQYQRTRDTAAPLAQRLGIAATVESAGAATHAQAVAARVRQHTGGAVVVVGHSNTVPAIIAALGGPALTIADDEYDHLFVLRLDGAAARLIRARF